MADVRVTLNSRAIRSVLRSPAMAAHVGAVARGIAAAAGDGYEVEVGIGPNRARAAVITGTDEARRAEAIERRLTKAVGNR